MFCVYTRPRNQVSVYRTIGPLVSITMANIQDFHLILTFPFRDHWTLYIKTKFTYEIGEENSTCNVI